jgi:peptidyl-prolyl cis-trans isomerase SurA
MHIQRSLWLIVLLLAMISVPARAEVVSRIAAVVNGDIITTHALDQALQGHLAKSERKPTAEQLVALRKELLTRLIEEQLVQQRIRALKLQVSDEEVENAIIDVQRQNKLSREQLIQAVQTQGQTFEAYRENLRKQILRYKLVGQEVRSRVDVPEREVLEYYKAHLDEYRLPATVTLSAVTFAVPERASTAEREVLQSAARAALELLHNGSESRQVAASYWDQFGTTAGLLGTFTEAELSPVFRQALKGVEKGGWSQVAETDRAIYLLHVDDRAASGLRQFEAVRLEITQLLIDQKTDGRIKEWTQALKQKAFIDIRL